MSSRGREVATAVAGICGRMGMETAAALMESPWTRLVFGVERDDHPSVGKEVSPGSRSGEGAAAGVPVRGQSSANLGDAGVLVDFSSAASAPRYAELCASAGVAYVCGVTGISESGMDSIREAARRVAVLYSPNMSAGVNLLAALVEEAAKRLPGGYDVEIVEAHHKGKVDVPSGTAAMLARRIASARGSGGEAVEISRPAGSGKRVEGRVTVHSLRGGDVAGDHQVFFIGMGETLALSHRAHGRQAFAGGVPPAVRFVGGAAPGFYTMEDVLE